MSFYDPGKLGNKLNDLNASYIFASPYPHIVIDNFLIDNHLKALVQEMQTFNSDEWINYVHINEKKRGFNKYDQLPPRLKLLIDELNAESFLKVVEKITGINDLRADFSLEGGGLHESRQGGFLNVHADYISHPHKPTWRRRVNIIIYLNEGWQDEWGGHLELWDKDMKNPEQKITPVFNRCVIFNTDATSYHGHPEPMTCPPETTRRSVALYYFTEENAPVKLRSTTYQPRPQDKSNKRWLMAIDNMLINIYTKLKRKNGMNDKLVSRILKIISKNKK
ncbi:MAG: 2OG-Fe(II) oxygenase [Flavipsychrobacter sp.]|nr:2OG-Fe(II) oxygenase [Flavipsychrobacter sp.]